MQVCVIICPFYRCVAPWQTGDLSTIQTTQNVRQKKHQRHEKQPQCNGKNMQYAKYAQWLQKNKKLFKKKITKRVAQVQTSNHLIGRERLPSTTHPPILTSFMAPTFKPPLFTWLHKKRISSVTCKQQWSWIRIWIICYIPDHYKCSRYCIVNWQNLLCSYCSWCVLLFLVQKRKNLYISDLQVFGVKTDNTGLIIYQQTISYPWTLLKMSVEHFSDYVLKPSEILYYHARD